MADLIGQMLGQYQIVEQIGLGGMATVYKAYQASMDRYVAIKVLPQQLADDPTFFGRFEQEARTIARLENKHILPVYDYGQHGGYTYLVMRYVGSGTLKDLIDRAALSLPDAVEYFTQIAEALQYAHEHGVIHRDVKPSNVLLGDGKQGYLTDFGIAKLAAGSSNFTSTGAVIGTPAYMSPEQCSGLPADQRSDIYSLGIVLYEMLTGRVPYQAETPVAVVMMHVTEPLPLPRSINPTIPEPVERNILRALAKDPDHRFQSAKEFADTLRAAVEDFTQQQTLMLPGGSVRAMAAPPTRPGGSEDLTEKLTPSPAAVPDRRLPLRWIGLAALAVIAVSAAAILLSGGKDDKTTPETPAAVTEPTPPPAVTAATWSVFTSTRGREDDDRQLVLTNDGLWMNSGGGLTLWQRDGSSRTLTSADGLPFNDIHTLAAGSDGSLWVGGGGNFPQIARVTQDPDGTFAVETFDGTNSGLRSGYAWNFVPGPDGTLLVGIYQSLIESWNGQNWTVPDFPSAGDPVLQTVGDRVWALLRAQDGTLWAGGPTGMAYLPPDSQTWISVPPPEDLVKPEVEDYSFLGFYQDPLDGAIWTVLLTSPDWTSYVRRLIPGDPVTWEDAPGWLPDGPRHLLRASDGALWVVTYDTVYRIDTTTGAQTTFGADQGLPGDQYFHLAEDTDGTIWLTTDTALVHYDGRRWTPFTTQNEPPANAAWAIDQASDGTLWFAGDQQALFTYDGTTWDTQDYLEGTVFDLKLQGQVVWIATEYGLVRWENGASRRYTTEEGLTSDFVTTLAFDPTTPDRLWIGTDHGLNALDTTSGAITPWTDGLLGPQIAALAFDAQGVLWIGTGYDTEQPDSGAPGLMTLYDGTLTAVAQRGAPLRDEDDRVQAIAFDDQGNVWIGTDEYVYRREGERWRRFAQADGAPENEDITLIFNTPDGLLVNSRYQGLYRFAAESGWRLLGFGHGGGGTIHRLFRAADGALWMLTETGVVRVVGDPARE